MRASRLVSLLLLLQTRGQMTARELARELEVSERTIYRDVDALSASGVPIYAERGPLGGVRLVEGYRTRLTGMTAEEAEAVFLSGLPGPAAQLGLGTVVAAAQLKVLAALPTELRARASRLVERFHLDAAAWFRSGEEAEHLPSIAEAVWEGRHVELEYDRGDRIVARGVDPLGLVLKAGIWYVVGLVDGQVRTYRASRIVKVELSDQRFERPENFDLASFWADNVAAYDRDQPRTEVVIRLAPDRVNDLAELVGTEALASAEQLSGPDDEGWSCLRLRLRWPEEALGRLLALGSGFEVLEPPEMRSQLVTLARAALHRHAAAGGVS
jgi:predicted DNA-binding transcriptional regulator YafY